MRRTCRGTPCARPWAGAGTPTLFMAGQRHGAFDSAFSHGETEAKADLKRGREAGFRSRAPGLGRTPGQVWAEGTPRLGPRPLPGAGPGAGHGPEEAGTPELQALAVTGGGGVGALGAPGRRVGWPQPSQHSWSPGHIDCAEGPPLGLEGAWAGGKRTPTPSCSPWQSPESRWPKMVTERSRGCRDTEQEHEIRGVGGEKNHLRPEHTAARVTGAHFRDVFRS